ncbi:MAG: class I SAM-dependent methyltransferase [Myxococcota bacterium]
MFHPEGPSLVELAVQAWSSTTGGYDLLAPKFDYTPFRTPDVVLQILAPHIGGPESIDSAIDICCGTGAAMRVLRPLCRREVVGVDLSQGMLDEARRRLADAEGRAEVTLERGDALDLRFRQAFDVATCFGAFGHILEKDEALFVENVHQVLKPGGRFVFVTGDRPSVRRPAYWMARGFNATMRVRNAIRKPPFIMYYLTFLLPRARPLLERQGFQVSVKRGLFPGSFSGLVLVIAEKR